MEDEVLYDEHLLDEVKSKRRKAYSDEKISEVIVTQCIVCVLLILIFVVMNIFYPEVSQSALSKYKQHTGADMDRVLVNAVDKIVEFASSTPK